MKNIDVINNFTKGLPAKTKNLRSEKGVLFNYSTPIAKWKNGMVIVTNHKYSKTTSTIQNMIKRTVPSWLLLEIDEELTLD